MKKRLKQVYKTLLFSLLFSMVGANAFAHEIEAKNADGVTIYYNYINKKTELEVTYRGGSTTSYSNSYTGSVVIPESVTYGGQTYSVTSIGSDAFCGCSSLTAVTIPNTVTTIDARAFYGCSALSEVIIGNSVTVIGYAAFSGCSSLTAVTIPNSVTTIVDQAFDGCSKLAEVTFSENITEIGHWTFGSCGITKLTIPNHVTKINTDAFYNCSSLKEVTIPSSVTEMGYWVFTKCAALSSVISQNPVPPTIYDYTFDTLTKQNAFLYVPAESLSAYQTAVGWMDWNKIATGIEAVSAEQPNTGAVIYTLSGVRCRTVNLSDLPQGIYIVNGKKVVVR